MPDWSYHPLFKPFLFRLPAPEARDTILRAVSVLGAMPGGTTVLDFMGHMKPSPEIGFEHDQFRFPSRVGLGCGLARDRAAVTAFERFGFGFIEAGPVTATKIDAEGLSRNNSDESISCNNVPFNAGADQFAKSVLAGNPAQLPVFVRVAHAHGTDAEKALAEYREIHGRLPQWIAALVIDTRWSFFDWSEQQQNAYLKEVSTTGRKFFLALSPDLQEDACLRAAELAMKNGATGISITGGINNEAGTRRTFGRPTFKATISRVRLLKANLSHAFLIGGGGIIEPADAIDMLNAGADLVSVYSGMVFSGPGLAKRINELLTAVHPPNKKGTSYGGEPSPYTISAVFGCGWLGIALIGAGLIITGASAITVALTTVILPYDEQFLGVTRAAMKEFNPNLLPFMSHDRVTYAGAGMSNGILFAGLSAFGARMGQRWSYIAARISCAFGFLSFLLFLGYHYLDPLHALVTVILFPFFLWALIKKPKFQAMQASNMHNTRAWRNSLIGQLLFVGIGCGLLLAGFTICKVGTSTVFVPEDLQFMRTTADALLCHNNHLLPAIAHDRAGFGGSLVTAGFAVLLTSLYGFRQGEGWVWWMLLIGGLPGFLSTLGIHFAIGYTSFIHLLPAYIATLMFAVGLTMSYRYLCVEPGVMSVRAAHNP